jgi:PAS domain S-box-containing protein
VFELTFVAVLMHTLKQVDMERQREAHARDVANHANTLLRLLLEAGTDSVLWHIMQQRHFYERYHEISEQVRIESDTLRWLVDKNPYERAKWSRMESLLMQTMDGMKQAHELVEDGDPAAAKGYWIHANKMMQDLFKETDGLVEEQQKTQVDTKKSQQTYRDRLEQLLWFGVAFNVFLALCLAIYFNKVTTSRLKVLMDNTVRLATEKELRPPIPGSDEIASLDRVFRRMAEALDELRRKERAIVENAVDVICSIGADGKFIAVNRATLQCWGYPPDELIGNRLAQFVHADDIERTNEAIKNIISDQSAASLENRINKKDGTLADMHWSVQWSATEAALFCVAHDISERKRVDRMKRDFVAMVSHDLRTPLTSIQGFLELLSVNAYGELSGTGKESLVVTEGNISRLIAMVNDLLDIEKMESGMLQLWPSETAVDAVIEKSLQAVEGFASQQKVKLKVREHQNIHMVADTDRLVQVLINLLSNAVKFSPKDSTVTIAVDDTEDGARISVEDIGRGVPEELREAIFERFKQIDRSDEQQKGGSGLGLAICKAIIERHGGKIGVESGAEGQGSRFWFCVPKMQKTENSHGPAPETNEQPSDEAEAPVVHKTS